jgi:DNA topoisomerase-1
LYDFDNLTEEEGVKLIEWKKQKEANRYISRWEEEDIAIENGRYGPFIRYKKLSIPLKYQGKKIADDSIPALTLEQVKWIMLEQNPDVFWKAKKADSDTKKKPTAKKKAPTKKKA